MIFDSQIVLWWDLPQKIIWSRYLQYSQNKAQIREKKNVFTKIRTTLEPLPTNYIITLLNWVSHRKCFPNWLKLSVVPKHVCESLPRKNRKIDMLLFWLSDTQFYLLEVEELYGVCSMGSVYSLTWRSNGKMYEAIRLSLTNCRNILW